MMYLVLSQRLRDARERRESTFMQAEESSTGAAGVCSTCGGFTSSRRWLPPYRVELECWGDTWGDLAFSIACEYFLASERFRSAWNASPLTGIESFEPVEVVKIRRRRKRAGAPPLYWKANVIQQRGRLDYVASGIQLTEPYQVCPTCNGNSRGTLKRSRGVVLAPGSEPAEDLFVPLGGGDILVTPAVQQFCQEQGITNAVFCPAETYAYDFYPGED